MRIRRGYLVEAPTVLLRLTSEPISLLSSFQHTQAVNTNSAMSNRPSKSNRSEIIQQETPALLQLDFADFGFSIDSA